MMLATSAFAVLLSLTTTSAGAAVDLRPELLQALDSGQLAPELAAQVLARGTVEDRELAVQVLAATADARQLPMVESFAENPAARVRRMAQVAAGRIGAPAAATVRAGLNDPEPSVRAAAAWAAAALGEPLAGDLLQLVARERSPEVLELALAELWRLPAGRWEAVAAAHLEHGSRALRRAATYALGRTGGGGERAALGRAAEDADPLVRATALGALWRGEPAPRDAEVLARGLDDPDWRVAAAAASSIGRRPELRLPPGAADRLRSHVASSRPHLQAAAVEALGAHPEIEAEAELRALIASDQPWPAAQALLAMARRNPSAGEALAVAWLTDEHAWRRRAAARAAALLPQAVELRRQTLGGASELRLAWLETVQEPTPEELRPLLADADPAVRGAALDALVRAEAAPPAAELLVLAERWSGDAMADARAAALAAVVAAGEAAEQRAAIAAAAADPDPALRALVLAGADRRGLAPPALERQPRHPAEWYRELAAWHREPRWLDLVTVRGTVRLRLEPEVAPITARTVWELAEQGFYDGLTIHRVVPGFVVQGGDPRGDGWGGPGFVLPDEPSLVPFDTGRLGIATSGPNTGGSQLFVTLQPADHLTGRYTSAGAVVRGMEVLEQLQVGDRILAARVASGAEPEPPPPVLRGAVGWADLAVLPGWAEEHAEYTPNAEAIARLRQAAGDYRIVVVLGTWCSDSRREVPRLVRVLEEIGSERFALELWAVDRTRQVTDPAFPEDVLPGRTPDLVATIVVLDAATRTELGRVVETAERPLEELLVELIAGLEGWE